MFQRVSLVDRSKQSWRIDIQTRCNHVHDWHNALHGETQMTDKEDFEVVRKCSCGKPIRKWMLKYSSTWCAECDTMWSNEARFMKQ